MKKSLDYIFSNMVFITRIPIKHHFQYKSDQGNVRFFPLIGIILGLIMGMITLVSQKLFGSLAAATISVFTMVVLTGGIHLDGLSDMADGLLSYKDKDAVINIMKDSRIGAMGVIALICILSLKLVFVNLLLESGMIQWVFLYPLFGRLAIVNACYFGKPIAQSKLGKGYIGNMRLQEFLLIQGAYSVVSIVFLIYWGQFNEISAMIFITVWSVLVLILLSKMLVIRVQKQINGISGDILGGACELGETIVLPIIFLGAMLCKKLI